MIIMWVKVRNQSQCAPVTGIFLGLKCLVQALAVVVCQRCKIRLASKSLSDTTESTDSTDSKKTMYSVSTVLAISV